MTEDTGPHQASLEVVDAQLHCWLSDRPSRPWSAGYRDDLKNRALNILIQSGVPMPPETLLVEMAAAGVDAGVLTPQGVYGNDNSLELLAAQEYPRKFAVVGWVDHLGADVADRVACDVARGMLGVRLLRLTEEAVQRGDFDGVLRACEQHELAVAVMLPKPLHGGLLDIFRRYEGIRFMVDHLGVGHAPPAYGLAPMDPWERLPDLLELARHANVSVKLTGGAALSHEAYPYRDIWPGVLRIVEAFGPERTMWGSDITRTGSLHTYRNATTYLNEIDGLSSSDRHHMYGRALRNILRWNRDDHFKTLRAEA